MPDDKARVLPVEGALCPDFDAMDGPLPMRRKIGREYKEVEKDSGKYDWVPTGKVEEISKRTEYARAIADGDLLAADKATADWVFTVTRKKVTPADAAPAATPGAPSPSAPTSGEEPTGLTTPSEQTTALETPDAKRTELAAPAPPPTTPEIPSAIAAFPEPADFAAPEPTLSPVKPPKERR